MNKKFARYFLTYDTEKWDEKKTSTKQDNLKLLVVFRLGVQASTYAQNY